MWPFRRHVSPSSLDAVLLRYVQRELPDRLGLPRGALSDAELKPFSSGSASHLRHVEVPGGQRLVLRVFFRRTPLKRLAAYRRLCDIYESNDIPVPPVRFIDDTAATWRRYGMAVLAEELVEGEPVESRSAPERVELLNALAPIVARLHGVTSTKPGEVWDDATDSVAEFARNQFTKWLGRIQELDIGPDAARCEDLIEWYASTLAELAPERLPLIHGGLSTVNVLVVDGARPLLVDVMAPEHWFAQWDLLFLEWLVKGVGSRSQEAVDAYVSACGDGATFTREEYERTRSVFVAAYHVHRASTQARRAVRGKSEEAELARDSWARAEEALKASGAP